VDGEKIMRKSEVSIAQMHCAFEGLHYLIAAILVSPSIYYTY